MSDDSFHLPVASDWWRAEQISSRVTRIWEPHVTPLLRCNIWHVRGHRRDLLVDSGLGVTSLRSAFPSLFEREPVVVATHSHHDHVGGLHEFRDRRGHALEAELVSDPPIGGLLAADLPADECRHLIDVGYEIPPVFLDALPTEGYDVNEYRVEPAPFTQVLDEDDFIDLGDVRFRVVHLPGHTPGSIGLLEEASGILFSGDALYDGPLLDELPESDQDAYVSTMKRLLDLPITVVYAGHDSIFDRARLTELATGYISSHAAIPLHSDLPPEGDK